MMMRKGLFDLAADNSLHLVGCGLFGLVILAAPAALLVYYVGPVLAELLSGTLGAVVVIMLAATPIIWLIAQPLGRWLVAHEDAKRPPAPIFPPTPAVEVSRGFNQAEVKQLIELAMANQPRQLAASSEQPTRLPSRMIGRAWAGQAPEGSSGSGIGWRQ